MFLTCEVAINLGNLSPNISNGTSRLENKFFILDEISGMAILAHIISRWWRNLKY